MKFTPQAPQKYPVDPKVYVDSKYELKNVISIHNHELYVEAASPVLPLKSDVLANPTKQTQYSNSARDSDHKHQNLYPEY